MADPAARHRPLTLDDYFRLEEEAVDAKHEYVAGEVYAMTGGSRRHNYIAGNIFTRLRIAARGGPCRVYFNDVKLRAARDVIYYPDIMVACGPEGADPLVEDAPCLVVEVLSPSTQAIDRREKAMVYKQLAGLRAYVIVEQERRRVQRHWRDDDGAWWHEDVVDAGRVAFPCPAVDLTLDEIYEGVEPDPATDQRLAVREP